MATLSECFPLLGLLNDSELVGLEPYVNEERVLVTLKDRGVFVYKVRDQKPLYSCSLRQSQTVTCAAVVNHVTSKIVAVLNARHIYQWSEDEASLEKGDKIRVEKDVFGIVSVAGVEPIVVFTNGQCQFLGQTAESPLIEVCKLESGEKLLWAGAALVKNKVYVVITTDMKTAAVWICVETHKTCSTSVLPHKDNCKLLSTCIQSLATNVKLFTLWSDGLLRCITSAPSDCQVKSDVHKVPGVREVVAMVSCSKTHLAFCGLKTGKDLSESVVIWDTKFATCQASLPLSTNVSACRRIYWVGDKLFIPHKTSLQVYPFTTRPSTLSAVLGSIQNVDLEQNEQVNGVDLFRQLISQEKTPNKTKFHAVFNKFLNLSKTIEGQHLLQSNYSTPIMERCLAEESFWPRDDVEQLLLTGRVSPSCCMKLLQSARCRKDVSLVHTMLHHVPDVSEDVVMQALMFFFGCDDADCTKALTRMKVKMDELQDVADIDVKCPFSLAKCYFINQVLVLPYNDVFLLESLRKLDFPSVLSILGYQHYLLSSLSAVLTNHKTSTWPSLLCAVDWTCLICDAHMTQLILSPDAREVLLNLHCIVTSQTQFYDELVSLEGILSQLKEKCEVTQKQNPGLYNIHVLTLR